MQISFLITLLLAAAVCSHGKEVKDSAGNPIKTGAQYFIQRTGSGNTGGGLVPASKSIIPPYCPLVVTQTALPFVPGAPVSFGFDGTALAVDTPVTIEFQSDLINQVCDDYSAFWAVDQKSNVIIGGDREAKNAKFTIEEAQGQGDNTYKLISDHKKQPLVTITGGLFTWLTPRVVASSGDHAKETELLVKFTKYVDPNTPPSLDQQKVPLRMFPFY